MKRFLLMCHFLFGAFLMAQTCPAITTLPWTENFDSMTSIGSGVVPSCWKQVTGTNAWTSANAGTTTYNGPRSAPNYMQLRWSSTNPSELWTPGFALTAGVAYEFSFYYNSGGTGSSYQGFTGNTLVNSSQSSTGATTLGAFITASQAVGSYTLYTITYTPTTTGTFYFGVSASSNSSPWYLGLDDFKLRKSPTCADATGFSLTSFTATSAVVTWTLPTPVPAGGYDVYYSTSSAYPTATVTPQYTGVTGPTQTITPLTANTTYYIWLRARCGSTNIGDWVGPIQLTTLCASITTLPWMENFDTMPTIGSGIVPSCWKQITGTNPWISSNTASTTYNSPRSTPNYMRQSYGNTNASQLWTPGFALTAGTNYEFSFYYNSGGTGSSYSGYTGTALVSTSQSMTGATTLGTFITATQAVGSYTLYKVYYTPTTSGTYFFGTRVSDNGAGWYLGLDDFKVRVAPTCLDPQGFTATAMTATSATMSWTVPTPAPAGGYDIYYTTTNTVPAPTVTPQYAGVTGPTQTISPLSPTTTYYVWIRARCSATDIGDWSGPVQITTPCAAITTLPWTENFDTMPTIGTGIVPSCWKQVTGSSAWISSNAASTTYNSPRSTPNYMRQSYGNTNASQMWTPGFALTAGTSYEYSFYYNSGGTGSSYSGFVGTALVNTVQSMTGASTLGTFITASQAVGSYTLYKVYYTPTTTGTYYFGVSSSSSSNPWYLGLDDFKVRVAPTCLDPQNFVVTNTTTVSTTVQWTISTPPPAGGYDVYYTTTPGVPLPTVTPQYPGVPGPSQVINGLTPSTTYYIWVRARCSATDIGDWTGPIRVYTNYCLPTAGGSSTSYYLNNITSSGGISNIAYTATSYNAYVNNSALTGIRLTPGQTALVNMTPSSGSSHKFYIWVDWNQDMVFDPATEAELSTGYQANVTAAPISSAGHLPGNYRVRFASSYIGDITPCGPNGYGNYVDYTLTIIPCSTTAPTITGVTGITNVNATVNWAPAANNLNYLVKWRVAGTTGWPAGNVSPLMSSLNTPPDVSYTIGGLQPSTTYEVIIIALCGTTEGTPSPITTFSTTCDPAPPFLTVSNITPTTALVSWNATANATFALQYRKVGSGTWLPAPPPANNYIPVSGTSYVLGANPPLSPALEPYTKYEVRVANICVSAPTVINPWSTPAVFTTLRTCDMPVPGLTITYMTTTTAQVQWDPFPGATYVVRYRKVGISSWTQVPSATNNLTITGLLEDTKYEMQVANVCSGVTGSWSDSYFFTTPTIVYCSMTAGSAGNEYISGVVVKNSAGVDVMKNDQNNIASTYSNFTTDATKIVTLVQGSTGNQLVVSKKWAGTQENAGLAAWIDFNRDGIFQPTERIMASEPSKNSPITATFNVPSDAFVSMTDYKYVVMRVALSRNEIPVNCVSMANGEVEDYLVRITKTPIATGINPDEIVIYPNPVTTILYVKNMEDRATYKIYNAAGQLLKSGIVLAGKVDVSGLIKGVYVIDLQDSKNNVQKKFIKN